MFKFNFNAEGADKREEKDDAEPPTRWSPAKEVAPENSSVTKEILRGGSHKACQATGIRYVSPSTVSKLLKERDAASIPCFLKAEADRSDLIPAVYEGGLKVWECTHDLVNFVYAEGLSLRGKNVLDLGCGAGIVGVAALLEGATVAFQDYNEEVIRHVTMPNALLNLNFDEEKLLGKCRFFSGDWEPFAALNETRYDYIFTSETIYNPLSYEKLHRVFERKLEKEGAVFLAAKCHYFGVGGGIHDFEELVAAEKVFECESVWECREGVKREILKLTFYNGRLVKE